MKMTEIEELHNKILYLEERLNKLNEQQEKQQEPSSEPQSSNDSKKESNIFEKCECPTCHKTFANKYVMKTHIAQKHGENDRTRYECKFCHKSFVSPYYLKYHLSRLHPEGK